MFHPQGPTFFELARQALSSTRRGYDLLAPKFDLTPFRTPDALLEALPPLLGPAGSLDRALDLCCGTGAAIETLHPLCRRQIVGVDFSPGMLQQARDNLEPLAEPPEIRLAQADVLALDAGFDASFDLVTCFGALGHFVGRDQLALIRTARRALAPGGRFVTLTSERPPAWSPRLWLALAFNAAMTLRNTFWRPPFVMYYLSFLLPAAQRLLEAQGFKVEIHRGICDEYPWIHLVVASVEPRRPAGLSPASPRS